MQTISQSKQKAKKQHKCDWCELPITIGTEYERQFCEHDGDTYTWKNHISCAKIARELKMFDWCDEGVTGEDFQEFIKDEYCNIMCKKYSDEYKAIGFVIPSFEDRLKFVLKEHGIE